MKKRTRAVLAPPPEAHQDWSMTTEWAFNGRHVRPGTEVSIRGERGRFRFLRHVSRPNGVEWIDVFGGPKSDAPCFRSFRPERIRTVHRLPSPEARRVARKAA